MTNRITFQNLLTELTGKISFLNSPDEISGAVQPLKSLTMLKYIELEPVIRKNEEFAKSKLKVN